MGKLLFLWLFDLSLLVISSSLRYNFVTRKILDGKSNKTTSLFFSINFLLTIPTYGEVIHINSLYYHYHFTNPRSTKVSFHSPSLRFLKLFPISGANYRSYSISKSFLSYIKENRCAPGKNKNPIYRNTFQYEKHDISDACRHNFEVKWKRWTLINVSLIVRSITRWDIRI